MSQDIDFSVSMYQNPLRTPICVWYVHQFEIRQWESHRISNPMQARSICLCELASGPELGTKMPQSHEAKEASSRQATQHAAASSNPEMFKHRHRKVHSTVG